MSYQSHGQYKRERTVESEYYTPTDYANKNTEDTLDNKNTIIDDDYKIPCTSSGESDNGMQDPKPVTEERIKRRVRGVNHRTNTNMDGNTLRMIERGRKPSTTSEEHENNQSEYSEYL